jgi:S1-C subfamily serine protease
MASKQGSGFVIDSNGSIATNRHVIEDADSLKIQLSNGEIYDQVYVLADDARRDLALLRIPAKKLSVLSIPDIEDVDVGDRVYVIGSPMGLQNTFTDGLVSAKRVIEGTLLIQISAPISPGSSGGPVLNEEGVVVGVATLSLKDAQNLNIAIPSRYVSGLLSISATPIPFTEVAERFVSSETRISENDDGQLEDLEPWAQSLVLQVAAVVLIRSYLSGHL